MPTISERLAAARLVSSDSDPLVSYERSALLHLERLGLTTTDETFNVSDKERWPAWAADSILFAIDELRAGRLREAVRGWGQIREYQGRNGEFLPAGLSDACRAIQNELEKRLREMGSP